MSAHRRVLPAGKLPAREDAYFSTYFTAKIGKDYCRDDKTTSGRFGFRVVDLRLPSRVSMEVARVYDSGIRDSVPGVPVDDDPRLEHDLGSNWLFSPAMMMVIPTGTGYLLITDEGGSVPYGPDSQGSGDYIPLPNRPLKYGRLTPLTSQGKLKIQMANGNTRTLGFISPQPNYWLEKEEDRSGNYVEYQYYQGYLKKMVSSNGHWIEFHRPQWGEPAPAGTPNERVVALTDSTGRRVEYAYDSNECLQTVTDLDGHDWAHTYHDQFRISTLQDPLSRTLVSVTFDGVGRTTSISRAGIQSTYAYESTRTIVTLGVNAPSYYEFDAAGLTTKITDPEGGEMSFVRDALTGELTRVIEANGAIHDLEHDADHRITKYTGPIDLPDASPAEWIFAYSATGDLVRQESPLGGVKEFVYDANGRLTQEGIDLSGDGSADAWTTLTLDSSTGDILVLTDPTGVSTTYTYDTYGQLATIAPECVDDDTDGVLECPLLKTEFSPKGTFDRVGIPASDVDWNYWEYDYDQSGRLVEIKNPLNAIWAYGRDASGAVTSVTNPLNKIWTMTWTADARPLTSTDPIGTVEQFEYDASGRLTKRIDGAEEEWLLDYDDAGRLTLATDPEGVATSWTFDAAGRAATRSGPGPGTVTILRDANGQITERQLPDGQIERFEYDVLGRTTLRELQWFTDTSSGTDRWTTSYDTRSLPLTIGQEITADDGSVLAKSMTYQWDTAGRSAGWTDAFGRSWTVHRDARGRAYWIQSGSTNSRIYFHPHTGRIKEWEDAESGREIRLGYDLAGQLVSRQVSDVLETVEDWIATRGANGAVDSIQDLFAGNQKTLTYDDAGRVETVVGTNGYRRAYAYSPTGQVLGDAWTTAEGLEDYRAYEYDRAGRLLSLNRTGEAAYYDWDFAAGCAQGGPLLKVGRFSGGLSWTDIHFDADSRAALVTLDGETSDTVLRQTRWVPGGLPSAVRHLELQEDLSTTISHFVSGPSSQTASYDPASPVVSLATESALSVLYRLDDDLWRMALPGRSLGVRDEQTIIQRLRSGSRSLTELLGGHGTGANVGLPKYGEIARDFTDAWASRFVDAAWAATRPDELGGAFDESFSESQESSAPSSGVSVHRWIYGTSPWARIDRQAITSRPSGLVRRRTTSPDNGHPSGFAPDLDPMEMVGDEGGGRRGGSPRPPEPIRNADVHSIGVHIGSGAYHLNVVDARIPGRGLDLVLARSYSSQDRYLAFVGKGWSISLIDDRIEGQIDGGPMSCTSGKGCEEFYKPGVDGIGEAKRSSARIIEHQENYKFDVREQDGTIKFFENKRLVRIARPGATPIEIDWAQLVQGGSVWYPVEARLLSCDDDSQTNPAKYVGCTPEVVGKLVYGFEDLWPEDDRVGRLYLTSVKVQAKEGTGWDEKTVRYNYSEYGDYVSGATSYVTLSSVTVESPTYSAETVASYGYAHEHSGDYQQGDPSCDSALKSNLLWIKDGSDTLVLALSYRMYDRIGGGYEDGLLHHDRVGAVYLRPQTVPDYWCAQVRTAPSSASRNISFSYYHGEDPFHPPDAQTVTVNSAGRESVHEFSGSTGLLNRITRPDGSVIEYAYDQHGHMTWARHPSGREEHWDYNAGLMPAWTPEQPEYYREVPSDGSANRVTCAQVDPLTGEVWRKRESISVPHGQPFDCEYEDAGGTPYPGVVTTTRGWQIEDDDGDPLDLSNYLYHWDLEPDAVLSANAYTASVRGLWHHAYRTEGRIATEVVTADGNLTETGERPVTENQYAWTGYLTKTTAPDGKRTFYFYLDPGELGPAEGRALGQGLLARVLVEEDVAGGGLRVLKEEKYGYDAFGNVTKTLTRLDDTRWVVTDRVLDLRNRVTKEVQSALPDTGISVTTEFAYDAAGRVTQKRVETSRDPYGTSERSFALTEFFYNAQGLVSREVVWPSSTATGSGDRPWVGEGLEAERALVYDDFGNTIQEATLLNAGKWSVVRYAYDVLDRVLLEERFAEPYQDANPPSHGAALTGKVERTRTWYDSAGRATWAQHSGFDGTTSEIGLTTKFEYDGFDRVWRTSLCMNPTLGAAETEPTCSVWEKRVEQDYDTRDNVIEQKTYAHLGDPSTGLQLVAWTKTSYDERDRAFMVELADDDTLPIASSCVAPDCEWVVSKVRFDTLDRPVRTFAPSTSTGWAISDSKYDGLGRVLEATDPLGNVTEFERNESGRATLRRTIDVHKPQDLGSLNGLTIVTLFGWDELGRPATVSIPDPASPGSYRVTRQNVDARGLPIERWLPKNTTGSGDMYKKEWDYDGFGRKASERVHIESQGSITDGWRDVEYAYDRAGRPTLVTVEPDDGHVDSGVSAQDTAYEFDAQGRRTLRRDENGREERTTYSSLGLATTLVMASTSAACGVGGTECVTISRVYDDALERLTSLTASASATGYYYGTVTQEWAYDGMGRVLTSQDENSLRPDLAVSRSWEYDSLGRPVSVGATVKQDAETGSTWDFEVASAFDSAGHRTGLRIDRLNPDGTSAHTYSNLEYEFDNLSRIEEIRDAGIPADPIAEYRYVGAGKLVDARYRDGSSWRAYDATLNSIDFDSAGRRLRGAVADTNLLSTDPGYLVFEESMTYDAHDQVESVRWTDAHGDGTAEIQTFAYDEMGQLIEFRQGAWDRNTASPAVSGTPAQLHDWRLDELGNWREHREEDETKPWMSPGVGIMNEYTSWQAYSGSTLITLDRDYESVRNFLTRSEGADGTVLVFRHDPLGRLVEVAKELFGGGEALVRSYGYNAAGALAWRHSSGEHREWFLHDGPNVVLRVQVDDLGGTLGSAHWKHVWAGSSQVAASTEGGVEHIVHADRLGSVVMTTEDNAGVLSKRKTVYEPYGRAVAAGVMTTGYNLPTDFGFGYVGALRETFEGREFYLMGARWYEPGAGRFIELDPIGLEGGLNLYAYAYSSPLAFVDPTGLAPEDRQDFWSRHQREIKATMNQLSSRKSASEMFLTGGGDDKAGERAKEGKATSDGSAVSSESEAKEDLRKAQHESGKGERANDSDSASAAADSGATYTLIVFVDQPGLGGDDEVSQGDDIGHAWVVIEDSAGNTVASAGLWPSESGEGGGMSLVTDVKGEVRTDDKDWRGWDVARSFTIGQEQMQAAVDFIDTASANGRKGKLAYSNAVSGVYNCASFAIGVAAAAGIDVPQREVPFLSSAQSRLLGPVKGIVPAGPTPGTLGQDLRTMSSGKLHNPAEWQRYDRGTLMRQKLQFQEQVGF